MLKESASLAGRTGQALRTRVALIAIVALATTGACSVGAATASAQYSWGCTYTYPNTCFDYGSNWINYLITADPKHAATSGLFEHVQSGYPPPHSPFGAERYVCGAMWYGGPGVSVPWSCSWGENVYTFPYSYGDAIIGSELHYSQISLYQMINYTEP